MVVSLVLALRDDSGSLQQVVGDVAAHHAALGVEVDLDELAEPRRVVVASRLSVSERLQDRVGVENLGLQREGIRACNKEGDVSLFF